MKLDKRVLKGKIGEGVTQLEVQHAANQRLTQTYTLREGFMIILRKIVA
jgi:hypothetical protein